MTFKPTKILSLPHLKLKFILSWFLGISFLNVTAQKYTEPTTEEISQAQELRKKYDKSDVVILSSNEYIKFNLNREKTLVEVDYNINEKLMNINHTSKIQKYEFYDNQTVISEFAFRNKINKKTNEFILDEYFSSDDMFYNDARVKHTTLHFPLQGYIYLYEMTKKYKDIKYFTTVYFNDDLPVIHKEITIDIPKWLNFEIKEFNFDSHSIVKKITETSDMITYRYTIDHLAESKNEVSGPGPSHIYPHIVFIAKSFNLNGKNVTLFNSIDDLYKWYRSLIKDMKDDPTPFKNKVIELTSNAKTDDEKIKNIYYWVQDNIRYIAFLDGIAGFKPEDSQTVYEKKYGDCKGMANLTKQMLILAGFDARLTWIGTNHIAYDYSIPSLSVDNHMICTLSHQGKRYFLDSTEKYTSLGENAERIQGKEVLIEDGDLFIMDKIPITNSINNTDSETILFYLDGEMLKGHVTIEYQNESKTDFLYHYNLIKNDKKEEAIRHYLTSNHKNLSVSNISTSDLNNRDANIKLDYDFNIQNQASIFEDQIYIDLNYEKSFSNFDFKDRKQDFLLPYKTYDVVKTTFQIPTGYKVSRLPDNLNLKNDDYEIVLQYETNGNTIIYTKTFNFKNAKIKSTKFEQWQEHLKMLKNHYSDQIELSK